MKVNLTETMTISASIDWLELKRMIIDKVKEGRGHPLSSLKYDDFKINIEQETEGSPSYHIQKWRVEVEARIIRPQVEEQKDNLLIRAGHIYEKN